MVFSTRFITAAGVAAVSLSGLATSAWAESQKQEKCYGIVKAGKNDCAAADGAHSCASYSKRDAAHGEWILLPAGTCDRIVGGKIEPPKADATPRG